MTQITIDRAVLEQALDALDSAFNKITPLPYFVGAGRNDIGLAGNRWTAQGAFAGVTKDTVARHGGDPKSNAEFLCLLANSWPQIRTAITAGRAALAQTQGEEPLGWLYDWTHSSALGRDDETFTGFTTDKSHALNGAGHGNVRAVYIHHRASEPAPSTDADGQLLKQFLQAAEKDGVTRFTAPQPAQGERVELTMTPQRASYFMERFKREEKLLGPNERAAIDYVVAMLQSTAQPDHIVDANKMAPLTNEDIVALAHRKCWRYKRSSDPHHSDTYLFNLHTLIDFVRKVEARIKGGE
jgi:hypothetical protein